MNFGGFGESVTSEMEKHLPIRVEPEEEAVPSPSPRK